MSVKKQILSVDKHRSRQSQGVPLLIANCTCGDNTSPYASG